MSAYTVNKLMFEIFTDDCTSILIERKSDLSNLTNKASVPFFKKSYGVVDQYNNKNSC